MKLNAPPGTSAAVDELAGKTLELLNNGRSDSLTGDPLDEEELDDLSDGFHSLSGDMQQAYLRKIREYAATPPPGGFTHERGGSLTFDGILAAIESGDYQRYQGIRGYSDSPARFVELAVENAAKTVANYRGARANAKQYAADSADHKEPAAQVSRLEKAAGDVINAAWRGLREAQRSAARGDLARLEKLEDALDAIEQRYKER